MALILDKIGIVTGNTVEAYHVTQSVDAFTGTEAYDITISGSLQVTGSVAINGLTNPSKTNVLTYDTSTGQVFYTASNALPDQTVNTSSFVQNSQTGSFVTNSQTGSFSTGSSYVSSSILTPGISGGNEITFHLGDGTTHTQTINTGSGGSNTQISGTLITASHVPINHNPNSVPGNIQFTKEDSSTFNVTTGKTWLTASNVALTVPVGSYGVYINYNGSSKVTLDITGSNIGDEIEVVTGKDADGKIGIDYDTGQVMTWTTQSAVGGGFETSYANEYPTFKLVYVETGKWHLVRYMSAEIARNASVSITDRIGILGT
jgi:hypothetical protein